MATLITTPEGTKGNPQAINLSVSIECVLDGNTVRVYCLVQARKQQVLVGGNVWIGQTIRLSSLLAILFTLFLQNQFQKCSNPSRCLASHVGWINEHLWNWFCRNNCPEACLLLK